MKTGYPDRMAERQSRKFFEYVSGYGAPVVPRNEISEREARQRRTYYEVAFDHHGRVFRVTKMLDQKFELQYDYEYDDAGRVSFVTTTNADGRSDKVPMSGTREAATTRR